MLMCTPTHTVPQTSSPQQKNINPVATVMRQDTDLCMHFHQAHTMSTQQGVCFLDTAHTVYPQNLSTPQIAVTLEITPHILVDAALEMTLHDQGSIKFKVLVMQICTGSSTRAILGTTKNSKYKQEIVI